MARKEAMAQLDVLMNAPTQPVIPPPPVTGLTPEKAEKQASKKLEQEQKEEEGRLKAAKEEQEKAQQEQQAAIEALPGMIREIWRNTQVSLGKIPTYGSILFPLSILLVFFFLLLPVNGHTRAMWMWLTLTGQADIAPIGGVASGDFGAPTGVSSSPDATTPTGISNFLDVPHIRGINPFSGGTFAEDF